LSACACVSARVSACVSACACVRFISVSLCLCVSVSLCLCVSGAIVRERGEVFKSSEQILSGVFVKVRLKPRPKGP